MKQFYFKIIFLFFLCLMASCASTTKSYNTTVSHIDLNEYMGKWYVIAARPTFLEKNAYNSTEKYTWNREKQRVDIDFSFNKGSLDGPEKHIKQTAKVHNIESNAHWQVSPLWPLRFNYLVLAMDPQKQWVVVGVPSQKYIWIMGRSPKMSNHQLNSIKHQIVDLDYRVDNMVLVKHNP